jgi:hypothetical protein
MGKRTKHLWYERKQTTKQLWYESKQLKTCDVIGLLPKLQQSRYYNANETGLCTLQSETNQCLLVCDCCIYLLLVMQYCARYVRFALLWLALSTQWSFVHDKQCRKILTYNVQWHADSEPAHTCTIATLPDMSNHEKTEPRKHEFVLLLFCSVWKSCIPDVLAHCPCKEYLK